MPRVLIAVASKHGSTLDIAEAIGQELQLGGLAAEVHQLPDNADLDGYGAVILGSALYMGDWLRAARDWVTRNQKYLAAVPVWLFSSGPLGDGPPQPTSDPKTLVEIMSRIGVREHRTFAGKLDHDELGLGERMIIHMVHAPDGDFRDWAAIQSWARSIADTLREEAPPAAAQEQLVRETG